MARKKIEAIIFADEVVLKPYTKLSDPLPRLRVLMRIQADDMVWSLAALQRAMNGHGDDHNFGEVVRTLAVQTIRFSRCFPPFCDDVRAVHRATIPEFAGKVCSSYHDAAFEICRDRLVWLWRFNSDFPPLHTEIADTDEELAQQAANLATKRAVIAKAWKFAPVDHRDLMKRIEIEAERMPEKKPRNDEPTEADRSNVERVIEAMGTRNPSRDAIKRACKAAGVKCGSNKLKRILDERSAKRTRNLPSPPSRGDEPT